MDYVKDEFGNIIGYKGDDLSQQQAKLAGIPQGQAEKPVNNIFAGLSNQQERNMTYTSDDLQRGYKAVVPNQQAQQSVNSPSGHENVGHGNEVAMPRLEERMTATPKVQTVAQTPQYSQPRPQITNMDELASAMGYTSPEEEARLRKASVNNQRILAVADALRHIGNIANTVNYAPAQRFNQPWAEEQLRYEHGKAQRDAANARYLSYQRQKADQERAERKLEAQIKKQEADAARNDRIADARVSRYNAQNSKDAANQAYWETRARLQEEGWPLDKAIKEARKAQIEAQIELTRTKTANGGTAPRKSSGGGRRGGGSNGGKYWAYDEEGNIHYYPNKTMYEQGVEQFSKGLSNSETYSGTDSNGRPQQKTSRRRIVSKGGELARNARNRRNGGSGKVSNNSGFFNK